jgi:hypothetical protein
MNLGKEFINAAVRQVGRDAGRIVSNTIFGDAHAIKIKNVTFNESQMQYIDTETNDIVKRDFIIKEAIDNGYEIKKEGLTKSEWFGLIAFTLLLPFPLVGLIGPLWALIYSFYDKGVFGFEYASKMVERMAYKKDARYRNGLRPAGMELVEDKIYIPPTEEQEKKFFKKNRYFWCSF